MELHHTPSPVTVPDDKKYTDQKEWSYTLDDGMGWDINAVDKILCTIVSITASLPDGSEYESPRDPGLMPDFIQMAIADQLRNLQRYRVEVLIRLHNKRDNESVAEYYKKLLDLYVKDTIKSRDAIVQSFSDLDPSVSDFDHAWALGDGSKDWIRVHATDTGHKIEVGPLEYQSESEELIISPVVFERELPMGDNLSQVFLLDVLNGMKRIHEDSDRKMQELVDKAKADLSRAEFRVEVAKNESDVRYFLGRM